MNVVVDTNVLISGILWEGISNRIISLIEDEKLNLCMTTEILQELYDVLRREKFTTRLQVRNVSPIQIITSLKILAEFFFPTEKIHVIKEDPSDNMFLDCARVSGSKYIISRDRHLLNLKIFEGIKILTPENFILC